MKPPTMSLLSSPRRHLIVFAVVAAMLGGPVNPLLFGEPESLVGEPITVPLTVKTFAKDSPESNLVDSASRGAQGFREKPANRFKSEPKLRNPKYYSLSIGGREYLAILNIGRDAGKAELYIDFGGQGAFDASIGIEGVAPNLRADSPYYADFVFGPITIPKTDEMVTDPVEMMISCSVRKGLENNASYTPYLRISPHKFVVGKLNIGSGERMVAFVDGTCKGRFETFKPNPSDRLPLVQRFRDGATVIAVDLNKNGFSRLMQNLQLFS